MILGALSYLVPFLVVLTVIVFVHELGHYWVARRVGVRVQVFSIGFGPELVGWNDRHGTRWKISAIPLGGYVKFFGDADPTSALPGADTATMTEAEKRVSYHHQPPLARIAIAIAGPAANFIFAVLVFALMFMTLGQPYTEPVVGAVVPGGAAEAAGLKPGDRVQAVDGTAVQRFEELRAYVALRAETPIQFQVQRDGSDLDITVVPRRVEVSDGFGGTAKVGQIGIQSSGQMNFVRTGPSESIWLGVREVGAIIGSTTTYLGRMVTGRESGDQLSGPIGIAKMSGDVARFNPLALISLIGTLSVAIGFINLFPVPMLDGGHVVFYLIEAVRGRPLGERAQEIGFRIGLLFVLTLFVFATWNDLNRLQIFGFIARLFS